jgi:hypothetical protein
VGFLGWKRMADVITERRWCEEEQDADNSCHGIGSSCLRSLKAHRRPSPERLPVLRVLRVQVT